MVKDFPAKRSVLQCIFQLLLWMSIPMNSFGKAVIRVFISLEYWCILKILDYCFFIDAKNNAQTCLESKLRARLQRLIVLRTIKLARSHCFYTGRCSKF